MGICASKASLPKCLKEKMRENWVHVLLRIQLQLVVCKPFTFLIKKPKVRRNCAPKYWRQLTLFLCD